MHLVYERFRIDVDRLVPHQLACQFPILATQNICVNLRALEPIIKLLILSF